MASEAERVALLMETLDFTEHKAERLLRAISREKRTQCWAGAEAADAIAAYARALGSRNIIDFDDLIALSVRALVADASVATLCRERWRWISVDEFQDVDEQQYRLLTLLAPADGNLCVIGDPNQAIYGFRGADASCFERFGQDYPTGKTIRLARNYRSTGTIVTVYYRGEGGSVVGALPIVSGKAIKFLDINGAGCTVAAPGVTGTSATVGTTDGWGGCVTRR